MRYRILRFREACSDSCFNVASRLIKKFLAKAAFLSLDLKLSLSVFFLNVSY